MLIPKLRRMSPVGSVRGALRAAPALSLGLIFAAVGAPAHAGQSDALHPYAALSFSHDDNLLRVPEGAPPFGNQYGDTFTTAEAGLLFDHTYSRQRLNGQLKLSRVKFSHFEQLDYDGQDVLANWNWQIGNHLDGLLGASYNQTLAPYTDFRSDERNLRRQRRLFFDGGWRFHSSWQARAAATRDKFTYELGSQRYNNRIEDAHELGLDYLPPSGSTVGLVLRKLKGSYPTPRPRGAELVSDNYDQDEVKARIHWIASGSTNVQVLAGWVRRNQPTLGGTTSGVNGRLSADHKPRGRLSYNAALWREFAPIESVYVNYTLNKGASIGATYEAGAKLRIEATASAERRAYNARLLPLSGASLKDAIRSASLGASYTPSLTVKLSAALVHQSRSGSVTLGTGSFTSNSVTFNASAQF
ncbi:MAG: XrtB/PEP-CTERM-associated polysaccharide biosynthesis outer membrane protein EpsL [Massilia sp.]